MWDHVDDLLSSDRHTHTYTAEPVCNHHLEMVDMRTLCLKYENHLMELELNIH